MYYDSLKESNYTVAAEEWVLLFVIKKRKQVCVHIQNGGLMCSNINILITLREKWIEILKLGHLSCPCCKRHFFHLVTLETILQFLIQCGKKLMSLVVSPTVHFEHLLFYVIHLF